MKRLFFTLPFLLIGFFLLAQGCDAENGIVGGSCLDGFTACGTECVDLKNDSRHCGDCTIACGSGLACLAGVCVDAALVDGSTDGSLTDGPLGDGADLGDGAFTDGSLVDGSLNGDGSLTDGSVIGGDGSLVDGSVVGADGSTSDAGNCFPPFNTVNNCGTCGTQCAPSEACQVVDGGFGCVPFCSGGLINCSNFCVDTSSDPFNCGVCNKFCPSLICSSSICTGSNPGDLVVIGNDYSSGITGGSSQARLITNAVLIGSANPVRVFSYETYAAAASVATVRSLVATAAGGRVVQHTVVPNDNAMQSLTLSASYDVILIYDQKNANAGTLTALGTTFKPYLTKFLTDGGTVIILDGAAGAAQAMPQFIKATTLLDVTTHTIQAAGTRVSVVAPSDVVGVQVISPFAVSGNAVSFQLAEANGGAVTYVTKEGQLPGIPLTDPTVIHKNF